MNSTRSHCFRLSLGRLLFASCLLVPSTNLLANTTHDHDDIYQAIREFIDIQKIPSAYEIQEIDPRLRLESCPNPLSVRFPFSTNSTVEVSCPSADGWKIYLKLKIQDSNNIRNGTSNHSETAQGIDKNSAPEPEMTSAVVASKTLQRGIPIRPGDLELEAFPSNRIKPGHFSEPQDLFGMEPTQTISRGSLISNNMVRPPTLIHKGDLVTVIFSRNGLNVSNEGEALDSGGRGSKVSVYLKESDKTVNGIVTDKGVVSLP
jgi:flagella basal body P-ring formation protein FlgA